MIHLLERHRTGAEYQIPQTEELMVILDIVPNPAKVVVILEELGLPYTGKYLELAELKSEPYVSINPNCRLQVKFRIAHSSRYYKT